MSGTSKDGLKKTIAIQVEMLSERDKQIDALRAANKVMREALSQIALMSEPFHTGMPAYIARRALGIEK